MVEERTVALAVAATPNLQVGVACFEKPMPVTVKTVPPADGTLEGDTVPMLIAPRNVKTSVSSARSELTKTSPGVARPM